MTDVAHARLSPSSAHRWLRCAGSVNLCKDLTDDPTIHSSEGTAAHKVSDLVLTTGKDIYDYVGRKVKADERVFTVTEDWARALEPGIERIRELGGKFYSEHRVKLDRWMPGQFGTLDRGIVKKDLIVIGDLKFGSGVPVNPVRNEQAMIYGLGFWENIARHITKAKKVLIIIDQPRYFGAEGGGEWYTTVDELLEFGKKLKKKAAATYHEDAPLTPGPKQCEFCPAARLNICPAYTEFNMKLFGIDKKDIRRADKFGIDLQLPKPTALTLEERSVIVKHSKMMTKWLDSLHNQTLADALAGRPTPKLKVVFGRKGSRYWTHPKKVEKILRDMLGKKAYESKLKSPTQVSEILPTKDWKLLKRLIGQGSPKPALVDASDAREAIVPTIAKFKNLDDER